MHHLDLSASDTLVSTKASLAMHHLGGVGDNLVALRVHAVPKLERATRLQLDALVLLGQRCLVPANELISQNVIVKWF